MGIDADAEPPSTAYVMDVMERLSVESTSEAPERRSRSKDVSPSSLPVEEIAEETVGASLEPLMVTVTSCVAEPSAEVTVKVSVSVSVEPSS